MPRNNYICYNENKILKGDTEMVTFIFMLVLLLVLLITGLLIGIIGLLGGNILIIVMPVIVDLAICVVIMKRLFGKPKKRI